MFRPTRILSRTFFLYFLLLCEIGIPNAKAQITGEQKKWHRVSFTFTGPNTCENFVSNPFLDYRLQVNFTAPSGRVIKVSGFFAADGNAAETSATCGDKWRTYFSPDEIGTWTYTVFFRAGSNISIDTNQLAGTAYSILNGDTGSFVIANTDKSGKDFRGKGLLQYVGKHHLQFAETGEYFLKGGTDSPENFLGYFEFDQTSDLGGVSTPGLVNGLHQFAPHVQDWAVGDPTWQGTKGKGIIGALNYLSAQNVNSVYFLTYTIDGGDGRDTWIWTDPNERYRIDVSKMEQWEIVFSQMDRLGIQLHFVTQETENEFLLGGNGQLNDARKLYYRELVARFSHHLAIQWNIGEENDNSDEERVSFAQYIRNLDPYDHPINFHIHQGLAMVAYDGIIASPIYRQYFESTSLQGSGTSYNGWAINLRNETATAGKKLVIYGDEQSPEVDPALGNLDELRKATLWGNLMGGGGGVEWYFGYQNTFGDVQSEDFRIVETLWQQTKYATDFFQNYLPFWEMAAANNLSSASGSFCLSKQNDIYAIYLPNGGTTNINLPVFDFNITWFNPRTGGTLLNGSVLSVSGGNNTGIGNPPNNPAQDWVVLITRADLNSPVGIEITSPESGASFLSPANISITTDVVDIKDSVSKVLFYNGNNLLAVDSTLPYSFLWQNIPAGSYALKAAAVLKNAAVVNSSLVNISVFEHVHAPYVISISVDGLRPESVTNLGFANVPNFYRFRNEGAFTDNARADFNITKTLPNHTSQITGRPVYDWDAIEGHQWTENTEPGSATLHSNNGSYIKSVFDVVHDNGLRTGMFTSKTKFILYDQSYNAVNGATDTTGANNGKDKIDVYYENDNTNTLLNNYIAQMQSNPFHYSFVHLRDPDSRGHSLGFDPTIGSSYNNSVKDIDERLSRIFALVEGSSTLKGQTIILLTTDHGGTGTNHEDETNPLNYTIPFYAWGVGVAQGIDLYSLNTDTRINPGTFRPDFLQSSQPIRNGDVANLALDILGLPPITGSSIDYSQNLRLNGVPTGIDTTISIAINSPFNGATFTAPANVNILVSASGNISAIQLVEFFNGNNKIGQDLSYPYSFTYNNLLQGTYLLTAKATYNGSLTKLSNAVSITVNAIASVFTLVSSSTNTDIAPIANGSVFSLLATGTALNVRADLTNVGSVAFGLNTNANYRTESVAPYVLAGDNNGNYNNWNPGTGTFTVTATPYSGSNKTGTAGTPQIVTFTLTNQPVDCSGVPGGTATLDNCGVCAGGNTGRLPNENKDCAGVCFGSADFDDCGVCNGNNSTCSDCSGTPNGSAFTDSCNICVGGNTGKTACNSDCNGVLNGLAFRDSCNICSGGNTGHVANSNKDSCGVCFGNNVNKDCNGVCFGSAFRDSCNICVGGNTGKTSCTKDCNNVYGGSAFLDSCNICSGGNTGHLVNSNKDSCGICFGNNLNKDCLGVCFGSAIIDSCGVCNGNNSTCRDCAGVIYGTAFLDNCEICVGGNTGLNPCAADCHGDFGGTAFLDSCNICSGGNTNHVANSDIDSCGVCLGNNSSCRDCENVINGSAYIDSCGVCVGGNTGNIACIVDCHGDYGGTAFLDFCHVCSGGNTNHIANSDFDSCGVCFGNNSNKDCEGVCFGSAVIDSCGVCNGDNSSCRDCAGVTAGTAFIDSCGACVGGNTGLIACTADCHGDYGGIAFLDSCNICSGGNTNHIANSDIDSCGVCFGNNANKDCNRDCFGLAFIDNCGICAGGDSRNAPCAMDCNSDFGGAAFLDACNVCSGGNTNHIANSDIDSCGVCFGNNANKDCNGDCFGSAFIDGCGVCADGNTGIIPNSCVVDCQLSNWSNWSLCDTSCGGGQQFRTRTVIQSPQNGGAICGDTIEYQSCNTQSCPVDCEVSAWSNFSSCSATCGGGTQIRTRTILVQPQNGGAVCPVLQETQSCNTQHCPVDCQVSAWSNFSSCSVNCGGGTQTRTRTILVQPQNGGTVCPVLQETQSCNTQPCPVDCQVSAWGSFGSCSVTCGGGTQTRTRTVLVQPQNGGAACPVLQETQSCNTQPCPVDCQVSAWSNFSSCSVNCGGGTQTRTRTILVQPQNGGTVCPVLQETQSCNTQPCPVNCQVSSWSNFGSCSAACGGGTQTRTRTILVQPQNGGAVCPVLQETQLCNTQPCAPCTLTVVSLTLMNSSSEAIIRQLNVMDTVNLFATPNINIRADVCSPVGSVRFFVNGSSYRTETGAPYAIAGDNSGNFNNWNITTGLYNITATPYSNSNANGSAGTSKIISLRIINQQAPSCSSNANCNDNNPCTNNICQGGICVFTPINCNDNNPCTSDICNNGVCSSTAIVCNDNSLCTTDACVNGNCVFTPINCNDNNACTTDGCNGAGQCTHTALNCNDNNSCTTDGCNVNTGCTNVQSNPNCCTTVANCNDNNPCTTDACTNGNCTHVQGSNTPSYLRVINSSQSWKKLKLGYSSNNLWSPLYNVTTGGNNTMCITLRAASGNIDWSKIQIRPQGSTNSGVSLNSYLSGSVTNWTTICIPLNAFTSFNFSSISYIEIPVSLNANAFEIHIQKIIFNGGSSPFLWFGDPKTDNKHDGTSSGSLTATLIQGSPCGPSKWSEEEDIIEQLEQGSSQIFLTAYPNPFKDKVTIEFSLPQSEKVRLEMAGVDGRKVMTIFEGVVESNHLNQVNFQSGVLANGMYFYRLITESGEVMNRKLLLVR